MKFYFKGLFYRIFIDPLLEGSQECVIRNIGSSDKIIDIACGTGSLAIAMAMEAEHVTGIDLDDDLISYGVMRSEKKGIKNIRFLVHDASDMSCYADKKFDIAVTSMAIHQFNPKLAVKVLSEMKRIAHRIIIADYNKHMGRSIGRSVAWAIERAAGGDHYRNFRNYMQKGGLHWFAREAGLTLTSEILKASGVFLIAVIDSP